MKSDSIEDRDRERDQSVTNKWIELLKKTRKLVDNQTENANKEKMRKIRSINNVVRKRKCYRWKNKKQPRDNLKNMESKSGEFDIF